MKVAVTTSEPTLDSPVDPRFADAPYFLLVDTEQGSCTAHENPAADPWSGHGIVAARFVAVQGADAVISDDYCPHSFAALSSLGVVLYTGSGDCTAAEAVALLVSKRLPAAPAPTGHSHHARHARHEPRARRPIQVVNQ